MPFFNLNTEELNNQNLSISDEDAYLLLINNLIISPNYPVQIPKYIELKEKIPYNKLSEYKLLDKIVKALVYGWAGEKEKSFDLLCSIVKSLDKNSLIYKGNNNIYAALNLYLATQFIEMGNNIHKSEYYREALKIYREEDNYRGLASCFELQTFYFNQIKDYQNKIAALLEVVKYYRFDNNKEGVIKTQLRIAECYSIQLDQEEWEKYTELALDKINIAEAAPNLKAVLYAYIGKGYMQFELYKEASESLRNSVVNYRTQGISVELFETYKLLETCYRKCNLTQEVISCEKNIKIIELELHKSKQKEEITKLEILHTIQMDEKLSDTKEIYETKLGQLTNRLELTNDENERMIVLLSHDLKEPVRGITSFVSLLDKSLSASNIYDKEREYLQFIKQNSNTIAGHLEHLLKYIQIDNELNDVSEIDLNDLVREVKDNVMRKQKNKSAILSYTKLPIVKANKEMLSLLFYNLIENAIKFNNNTPLIKIDYKKTNNKSEIIISDNGIGVSDENKEKVFELFRKAHKNSKYDGWGVGLSMSRKIVNQLGGDIKIEDNTNGGSKIKFNIAPERVL